MLREKERPWEWEDEKGKERRAKIINDRLYMIHDSHWDKTSL